MDKETIPVLRYIAVKNLIPYIPWLKQYFGLPFLDLNLFIDLGDRGTSPDDNREYEMREYISQDYIVQLLNTYFDLPEKPSYISSFLWLAANHFYPDNMIAYNNALNTFVIDHNKEIEAKRRIQIREEIAQIYSLIQKRKSILCVNDGVHHFDGKPIEIVSEDKTSLKIHNTSCWFEALLENYLFPNCLPDVTSDEEAQLIWDKGKQHPGPKAQKDKNTIIHGVEMFLHDYGVVQDAEAPKQLCYFLYYYLIAMGLQKDPQDGKIEDKIIWGIKSNIRNLRNMKDKPRYFTADLREESIEGLSQILPEDVAHDWLFNPKRDKKEEEAKEEANEEAKEDAKEENVEIAQKKKGIHSLLSRVRDIFRKGVYKTEKKADTSHS